MTLCLDPSRRLRRWLIAGAFVLVYVYTFPYFRTLRSANEMPRVFLTQELVDRRTFRLDARAPELAQGSTFDVARTPDGALYSNKAPGLSFLAIPGYLGLKSVCAALGRRPTQDEVVWAFRLSAVTIPALLFLPCFLGVARRFAPSPPAAETALCAYGLGSMALVYGALFFSHQTAAVALGGAFAAAISLVRGSAKPGRRTDGLAMTVGLLAGLSILIDYQSVIAAAGLAIYLVWRSRRRLRDITLAGLASIPALGALLLYHQSCFGAPWRTGYSFAADQAHKQGFLGLVGPNAEALWNVFLAPDNGLLVLMPWFLISVLGAVVVVADPRVRARIGPEAAVASGIVAAYLLFVGSLVPEFGRAGWSVGPRYLAAAIPFAGWLAALGFELLEVRPVARSLAHGLVLVSVFIHVVAATTYPHWPTSFRNPLYEVSLRALGQGLVPPSLGQRVGLEGAISLLPVWLVSAVLALVLIGIRGQKRRISVAAAAALAAGIIVAYGQFPQTGPAAERAWSFVRGTFEANY